jgi:predicted MPP superfamily phosphohydrolase
MERILPELNQLEMTRRVKRLSYIALSLLIAFLFALGYSYFIEPRRLVVNEQTLSINGWDPALDGFKIVAIGDIHGGSNAVDEAKIRKLVGVTNAQNADLIVLLGDYVSQANRNPPLGDRDLKMPVHTVAQNLTGLKAKYGVIAVMGNHDDWYSNGEVTNELRSVGYTVLDNQIATLNVDGKPIRILGLRDQLHTGNWKTYTDDLKQVIAKDNGSGPIVALEHSPDVLPIITGDLSISPDLRLMLAAHTHGGQVWLPIIGTPIVPSSYGQKYSYGRKQENGVDMFVTSGVGTSILPFRFMMPPEIAVLTIRSEAQ